MKVARSCEMGVALGRVAGIARPTLPSTVAMDLENLAMPPADLKAAGLMTRANIVYDDYSNRGRR